MKAPALLEVREVSRRFVRRLDAIERIAARLGAPVREQVVHAVDRVSFEVGDGEVVGLVGESGCGKSTLGRVIAGLHPPSAGEVRLGGETVALVPGRQPPIQMIFQDPFAAL
jgi:peptide/nickel transport system ATP-binding protein